MNVVSIYIKDSNGKYQRAELFEDETISLTSKIQDIRDISKVFTDFSQSFTLPASRTNNKLFKHFYNYHISEGAFDARKKVDAIIEINSIPFREGKIFLNGVKMKDNVAYAYNITFFGNIVNLTDLLGDDELSQLDLSTYDHTYDATQVQTGLTTGLNLGGSTTNLIYPLITHTKRLYFDSGDDNQHTLEGNLAYINNSSHNKDVALHFTDIKPAIKVRRILDAVESKYGISFVSGSAIDFFDSTPINNLYLWLSRTKGILGGNEEAKEKVKIVGSDASNPWQHSSGDTIVEIDDGYLLFVPDLDTDADKIKFTFGVTPASGFTSVQYTAQILVDGVVVAETSSATGSTFTIFDEFISNLDPSAGYKPLTFIVRSNAQLNFTPSLNIQTRVFLTGTIRDEEILNCGTGAVLSTLSEVIIAEEMPKMKVIDFISGLFKMFNLTAYYISDRADADYGKIKVVTLDHYYNRNPVTFDITEYVDVSEIDVEATIPFSEINFNYEDPKTLLMLQHKETFNHIFGDEEFKPEGVDRGNPYEVKAPFEHLKYERLFDLNNNNKKDIQWGYSAGDNFKPELNPASGQPTGNYEPVLTAPVLFYGIRITGLTNQGDGINWDNGTHTYLQSYWKPSNTNENGTASVAPLYTLNFDNEVDEWNLTDYGAETNSLFKRWYQEYIEDVFNPKKRIFKVTAYLPNNILLKYRLSDRFKIREKVFTINSIDTNLKTGESKIELLNII